MPERIEYEINNDLPQQYFGINNRYPLRHRISKLNHASGEEIKYRKNKEGYDEIIGVTKLKTSFDTLLYNFAREFNKKKPKRKLVKGIKNVQKNESDSSNESININDYNKKYSEKDDEEFITNYTEQNLQKLKKLFHFLILKNQIN